MGTLLIKSESDKKYGDMKRSLINSMTHGYNHYPNRKAASYNMFCKYLPERIKKNNESKTMRDRPTTGVSFYQRATPIYGPPVAGTNDITEDMITFYKFGHRGHRYLL